MRGSWSSGERTRCSLPLRRSSVRWSRGRTSRFAMTGRMITRSTGTCPSCRILRCVRSSPQMRRWLQRQISNNWHKIPCSRLFRASRTIQVSALAGAPPSSTQSKAGSSTSPTQMKMEQLQEQAQPTRTPTTAFTLKACKRQAEASDPPRSPPCT